MDATRDREIVSRGRQDFSAAFSLLSSAENSPFTPGMHRNVNSRQEFM